MEKIADILAENLTEWRTSRALTQEKLAEASGVSVQTIQSIETGKRWPGMETLTAISTALKIPQSVLFSVAIKRPPPTIREALRVVLEYVDEHEKKLEPQSQLSPETLARLSSLNQAELDRLISLSHYDPAIDRQVKSALSGDRAEKRKKKA